MSEPLDSDIAHILRLAFGRVVPTTPVPVEYGAGERWMAFALHGERLPARVLLLRYDPQHYERAFRAFTVMRTLHDLNFPVPDVYFLGWSHYTRHVLLLMEYAEGRGDEGQPHAFFARVGTHFARTLGQLHQLEWDELPDLPVLPFYYTFDDLARRVQELGNPQLQDILNWLSARLDRITQLRHTVLHGDYTLNNVLAEHTHVTAVLGWDNAVLADPRCDVSYASAALGAYGVALSDQFLEAYEAVAGPVPERTFWDVFGALRLLVRLANTLATVDPSQVRHAQARALPVWGGLSVFVMRRTGLNLFEGHPGAP